MTVSLPIYMDSHATTPVDPRVLEVMLPYFTERFGNAASRSHPFGWAAEAAVEKAREQVAALVGADPKEIVFTSGATESDNLAVKGVAFFHKEKGRHVVTSQIEHKAVLDSCRALERQGWEVTYVAPTRQGLVTPEAVAAALRPDTVLVSVMLANNEVGTVNDVAALGALCRERGVMFHTDAVQGAGKVPLDVHAANVDLCSLSAHKMYGPKGVGALYVRRKPRARLACLMDGGGHERGVRSGTLNVPGIVGFGAAAELALREAGEEARRVGGMRDRLQGAILSGLPRVQVNGHPERRLPGNLNVFFACVEGESLLMALKDVAVSSGSACTSASLEPSYVLRAMGVGDDMAHSSIRFGLGRFNTEEEVDHVAALVVDKVRKLREMSPLWEMVQEGVDLAKVQWSAHA
jgi:cysteine desulfurase